MYPENRNMSGLKSHAFDQFSPLPSPDDFRANRKRRSVHANRYNRGIPTTQSVQQLAKAYMKPWPKNEESTMMAT